MADLVLAGTAALITGGGSGIGLGAARHLLRDGASVTIAGRSKAVAVASEITGGLRRALGASDLRGCGGRHPIGR